VTADPSPTADAVADLSHPGALELLTHQALARMAYAGTDGLPRVIPVGFWWNGAQVIVCTAPTSPKFRALTARPHVALTIDSDDASRTLSVRGVATMHVVAGVPDEYLAATSKSMTPEQASQFEQQVRSVYEEMARISIEPAWARYYDFGAGRIPEFLRRLTENHRDGNGGAGG
jgi:Pyridoxamine 5'-phosphate oxidase